MPFSLTGTSSGCVPGVRETVSGQFPVRAGPERNGSGSTTIFSQKAFQPEHLEKGGVPVPAIFFWLAGVRGLFGMRFLRPLSVLLGQLLHQSLVPGGQVVLFRPVSDVVNLPGSPVGSHQLEFVRQSGAVSLVFPENGTGRAGVGNAVPYLFRRN
mgnify:CR=1 FL=1